ILKHCPGNIVFLLASLYLRLGIAEEPLHTELIVVIAVWMSNAVGPGGNTCRSTFQQNSSSVTTSVAWILASCSRLTITSAPVPGAERSFASRRRGRGPLPA